RLARVPFDLAHPVWVEDPDFDLDYHLRRIAAPAPGSYHELADLAGDIASRQLDRSRPLWEMYIVEGLEHGHIGVIAKMHHSIIPKAGTAVVNVIRNRRSTDTVNAPAPLTAPRTSFNGAITAHRKVAYSIANLSDVKAIKNAFGTTVNDVVLAVVGGGMRRYLERKGDIPEKSLIATVPISVRPPEGEEDVSVGANKVSAMFTSLATDVADPVER